MIVTQGYFELFLPGFRRAFQPSSLLQADLHLVKILTSTGAAGSIARPRASWESGDQWLIGIN